MSINNAACNTESKFIAFVENCEYPSLAVLFQYWCISAHQSIMESANFFMVRAKAAKRQRHRSGRSDE
jgi:hypothetical protein